MLLETSGIWIGDGYPCPDNVSVLSEILHFQFNKIFVRGSIHLCDACLLFAWDKALLGRVVSMK